jgi:hypothetical protein
MIQSEISVIGLLLRRRRGLPSLREVDRTGSEMENGQLTSLTAIGESEAVQHQMKDTRLDFGFAPAILRIIDLNQCLSAKFWHQRKVLFARPVTLVRGLEQ